MMLLWRTEEGAKFAEKIIEKFYSRDASAFQMPKHLHMEVPILDSEQK